MVGLTIFALFFILRTGHGEQSCTKSAKLDLQIIVDSSGSVGPTNFKTMMEKIADSVIGQFEIGVDQTRVALFKYSMKNVMLNEIPLAAKLQSSGKEALQKQVKSTKFQYGLTYTAMAMRKALKYYQKDVRTDANLAKVCLVFTDGTATDADDVPAASKAWKDAGVTVYALGIGSGIQHQGLVDIAGDEKRAFAVKNFAEIGEKAKSLLKDVCKDVEKKREKDGLTQMCESFAETEGLNNICEAYEEQHNLQNMCGLSSLVAN